MHKSRLTALFLCLLVMACSCYGAMAEEPDQPSLSEVRSYFEHVFLRELFYSDPETVMGGITSTALYKTWTLMAGEYGCADSYDESDFNVYGLQNDDEIMMALVFPPVPEEAPQCYRLYLCYDQKNKTSLYFTNEYDEGMEGWGLVGLWTPEGEHHTVYLLPALDVSSEEAFTESLQSEIDQIFYLVEKHRTEPLTGK